MKSLQDIDWQPTAVAGPTRALQALRCPERHVDTADEHGAKRKARLLTSGCKVQAFKKLCWDAPGALVFQRKGQE